MYLDPQLYAICLQKGAFLRREARALGYTDGEMGRLLRTRTWHRLRHGAYTFTQIWDEADGLRRHLLVSRAAYRTARAEVVLSHTSSLSVHRPDVWDLALDAVHLTRRDGRAGRRAAGVVQHCGRVEVGDIVHSQGFDYMSATRTALEVTTITDVEHALVVVNDLLHRRLTTREQLRERYSRMEQWPHTLRTDIVLRLCDPRMESVGESRSDYLFFRQGLPRPIPQLEVRDSAGRVVGRLDFAWPTLAVWVEFDGRRKYDELRRPGETEADVLMREKRREELIREITGWECVHITWADLAHPERVAERIRAAFARSARRLG
ncbi:hypothetical protein [Nocardioides cynanchi]|uniref:hypothetical protein n=1 Tax=Nocardioides cynanchi TaxID=2558918 RepID=UPI0012468868|nr:hypothetical protein [Nocardioides cynanchi]